jgi:hypothetical protein
MPGTRFMPEPAKRPDPGAGHDEPSCSIPSTGRKNGPSPGTIEQRMAEQDQQDASTLLSAPPRVVNIGLELFAVNLAGQGAKVVHVAWSPPAGGNAHLAGLLDKLRS